MIVRLWRGLLKADARDAYLEHLTNELLPELRELPGFQGCEVLTRPSDAGIEVVVRTSWSSLEAIRGFAGEEIERAVVAERARPLLAEFDPVVQHFDLALRSEPAR